MNLADITAYSAQMETILTEIDARLDLNAYLKANGIEASDGDTHSKLWGVDVLFDELELTQGIIRAYALAETKVLAVKLRWEMDLREMTVNADIGDMLVRGLVRTPVGWNPVAKALECTYWGRVQAA